MSKLLIQEPPLQVLPSLAVNIGLNEAIVIQQLHYWIQNKECKGKVLHGQKYVYATYAKWKEDNFPFWSLRTIQGLFCKLEEVGLIVSGQFSEDKYDHTKYYSINYDHAIFASSNVQELRDVKRNLTETTPETTEPLTVPENSPEADPPQKAIGHFDPDIKEKTKPHKSKETVKHNPTLFIFASEIAILCSLSLDNGSKTECFKAAKTLLGGSKPPARPRDLHPYFAKGGKIYQEWPWSKGDRLKPMDISKHWPRLSGAIKPPTVNQRETLSPEEAKALQHHQKIVNAGKNQ